MGPPATGSRPSGAGTFLLVNRAEPTHVGSPRPPPDDTRRVPAGGFYFFGDGAAAAGLAGLDGGKEPSGVTRR